MKKKRAGFAALLCTLLIVLDQITKALTVSVLKVHDIVVIPGVLTLTYVENRGAAFGIFQNKKIFFFFTDERNIFITHFATGEIKIGSIFIFSNLIF